MFKNIGFIGLGVMGYHIASHLIKKKKKFILLKETQLKQKNSLMNIKNQNFFFLTVI